MKHKRVLNNNVKSKVQNTDKRQHLNHIQLITFILIITIISLSPVLRNSFINWDDNAYVFENAHLRKPAIEAVNYFFGLHYFIGNYIPFTMLTFWLENQISGLDPFTFHLGNLIIHLLNVILVYWFILLLSDKKKYVAAFVCVLFAIHPLHVESVAWVSELKDMLFCLFFIAGLITYLYYIEIKNIEKNNNVNRNIISNEPFGKNTKQILYFITILLFTFSTLSKPAAVTFPVLLLLIDYYKKQKFDYLIFIEKTPMFVIAIVIGLITLNAQKADSLMHDVFPIYQRLFIAAYCLISYIFKLILPINMSIYYPYPTMVNNTLPYLYYLAPLGLCILIYGIYRTLKYSRLVMFGFMFFLINMILVIQLISEGDAVMADHYTYIPYISLFFIIAMFTDWIYNAGVKKYLSIKPYIVPFVTVMLIACSYISYSRCEVWKDDDSLATDLLEKFPDDRLALNNKGFILYTQGRYKESIELFLKAIKIRPDYAMAYINLTNAYLAVNDFEDAMKITDIALQKATKNYDLLCSKGYLLCKQNKYSEGLNYYLESQKLKPDNIKVYLSIAACYYALHDYENWGKTLDNGLKLEPDNLILLNTKGYSLFLKGKYSDAIEYFKICLNKNPRFTDASINLANCYKALSDSTKQKN